jgi:hypothetical protein
MLPPLNLADSKGSFFSRKRVDGGSPRRRGSIKIIRPSPRGSIHEPTPRGSRTSGSDSERASNPVSAREDGRDLTEISRIPREFFVVETNAVLVPQKYPPNQYKSTLNAQGQWETVVFPALTPHNRQQVLFLQQTLDKMRATMPPFEDNVDNAGPETESVLTERRRLMVEYTSQETHICSYCFHELARQIKCICKEQSELLHEIRERYDAAVARLIDQVRRLDLQSNQQQDQLTEKTAQLRRSQDEAKQLVQQVQELELQVKAGPSVAVAQEAFKLRKPRRKKQAKELSEERESEHEDDSDSDVDEEEAEWRRQRDASSVSRPSISSKLDSTKELHLAATRLQAAFQKFQTRKEQTRITIRVEKQAAALDIQRSYRGFRERQLALHRRAVMRTIMRRREESAAVELMQANVRSYLLNRRRSAKLKLSAVSGLKSTGESSRALVPPPPMAPSPTPTTEVVAPARGENNDENADKSSRADSEAIDNEAKPNAKEALVRLLKTFRELASVITLLHHGDARSGTSEEGGDGSEAAASADAANALPPRPGSVAASEAFDDEDVELFQQTIQEAQALVGSLHVVLGTVPEEKSVSDEAELWQSDSSPDLNSDDAAHADLLNDLDQQPQDDKDDFETAPQTEIDPRGDDSALDEYDDSSLSIPFGARDAMRLQNYAELHLDDSLWSSATYYPATRSDTKQTEALLALALSSRDQRKRLVSLKQFIYDIYDAIVGKLKELPPRRLAETIDSHCHLALSFAEWRQQRSQLSSRAVAADQPGEVPIPVSFSIEKLSREHFRCRLGLPQLVDAALANLHESVEDFAAIDPDVKRFQEFLFNERSEEELVFCCMCRYMCTHCLQTDESPAGTATSTSQRQPMFHPVTMREVIDAPHALELAKLLFRVQDESSIVESDMPFTEVENLVYRQYLPTNGYQQFEAIVASFFVDPDSQAAAVTAITEADDGASDCQPLANTCRRPVGSPRRASALVRPTNLNQFHSKQYNAQAATSPVVRHQQRRSSRSWSPRAAGDKWLYFEEVLALLVKYRGEMNHFHLFSYWVQELFSLVASSSSDDGAVKVLDDAAFVETLTPLSLGPTERELRNIFHNSLRQRKLHVLMPLRVFTSVALLLLHNGLLSVSTYAPLRRQSQLDGDDSNPPGARQRALSIREENEDKEWRSLALKWRTQESAFEAAIEAIYHESPSFFKPDHPNDDTAASVDKTRAAHALQLLQLRQELYDLFASRSGRGRDLKRAYEIYEMLVNERLARVGGDTRLLDAHLGSSPSLGAWSTASFALS